MKAMYRINEIFYSIQGEGARIGTPNIFVRFAGCNMTCSIEPGPLSPGGFDCDTEFVSSVGMSFDQILSHIDKLEVGSCEWMIVTGGEPGLQLDQKFIDFWRFETGGKIAVETNGSIELPDGIDWITVSPKVAEHAIRQKVANEVKYVRSYGQGIPRTTIKADHYYISPAFNGKSLERKTFEWCVDLVKKNPKWKLSPQMQKIWSVL